MQFIDLRAQYQKIQQRVQNRINNVLESASFIGGEEHDQLERELAQFVGCKSAISVSNGTDALYIAMLALDIKPGDEVITPSFSFFAAAEMIALLGAKPVFVDIDPTTYNIDPKLIEKSITDKTKLIIPVSLYGQCSNLTEIIKIAQKHHIKVIEDAAQSFGATHYGQRSCSIAEISTTSFFPAKPLGCYGDGGAIFTNDSELAEKITEIKNHGQQGRYNHVRFGVNGRLDNLQAAILLEKLAIFPEEITARQRIANVYDQAFAGKVPYTRIEEGNTSVYAQYTIEVENRDGFREKLQEQGIPTAVHYPVPINKQPIFNCLGYDKLPLPHTERAAQRVCSLPMHPYLEMADQERIIDVVLKNI